MTSSFFIHWCNFDLLHSNFELDLTIVQNKIVILFLKIAGSNCWNSLLTNKILCKSIQNILFCCLTMGPHSSPCSVCLAWPHPQCIIWLSFPWPLKKIFPFCPLSCPHFFLLQTLSFLQMFFFSNLSLTCLTLFHSLFYLLDLLFQLFLS